jgi:hypothetical protein
MAEAKISKYLIEPRKEPPIQVETSDIRISPDKGLLGKVQRVFSIADQSQGDEISIFHIFVDDGPVRIF